jgi:hypothetical protein
MWVVWCGITLGASIVLALSVLFILYEHFEYGPPDEWGVRKKRW